MSQLSTIYKRRMDRETKTFICCCTIPTFLLYTIFVLYPVFNMFSLSFFQWDGLLGEKVFYGFENYNVLFQDSQFWIAFKNTITLILLVTSITFVLAMLFAALLSRKKIKGVAFFRILFYVPNILSIVVISAIFYMFYSTDYGILGPIVEMLGGEYTGILGDPKKVVYAVGAAMIWQAIGYYMVMYIAGMDSISEELYESSSLDGATATRQFFSITIPLTWQVIRVTFTFFIISTINMSFLFVKAMTAGAPDGASDVLLMYMSTSRSNGVFGYSMAIGTVLFIFAYTIALIVNKLTDRE